MQVKQEESESGDSWKIHWDQIKTCVYSGSWWIYKTAYGRICTVSLWRPYCRKRRQYTAAFQFGTQIYSYASSYEDTRSKSSSGWRMGKIWKYSGVGPDKSQKQIWGDRWSKHEGRESSDGSLIDICHLKNATKRQKYKGRVELRVDKDDSGFYEIFAEQGSSALQITAATVMDIISRLSGCAGQVADAVFAHTHVKKEDAPKGNSQIGMSRHL